MNDKPSADGVRRRLLPTSLQGRFLLIVALPMILLQLIVAVIFFNTHWNNISRRLSASLAGDVGAVMDMLEQRGDLDAVNRLSEPRFRVSLRRTEFKALPENRTALTDVNIQILMDALGQHVGPDFTIDTESYPGRINVYLPWRDGILELSTQRKRVFSHTTYLVLVWMVGASVLLLGIAVLFLRNQLRPIRRLAVAAHRLGRGEDSPTFRPEGAHEVRQAASAFLDMRDRIQRHMAERTRMLAGVSHDLRTPLTRMKLQLAMVQGQEEAVRELCQDIRDMERMLDGYLAFARGDEAEPARRIDLGDMLADIAARMDHPVELDLSPALTASLRPNAFRRLLGNVLENAARYAGRVRVSAARDDDRLEIIIDDDGPGIPPEQREEVFRPFVRLEDSRNPDTGGIGLGLSIVRDVIHRHGGEVELDDSPLGGLRVRLILPI